MGDTGPGMWLVSLRICVFFTFSLILCPGVVPSLTTM